MRRNADSDHDWPEAELGHLSTDALEALIRHVEGIGSGYRDIAKKIGQLYMAADGFDAASLTQGLDDPMRIAARNELTFAGMLNDLRDQLERSRE